MTRKDLQLIADTLRFTKPREMTKGYRSRRQMWESVVLEFAISLNKIHVNFDNERFIRAAGYYE